MTATATVTVKTEVKAPINEQSYLCALTLDAPVRFLDVPVSRTIAGRARPMGRVIQCALETVVFRNDADMEGIRRYGRLERMTDDELTQFWAWVERKVVKWKGRRASGSDRPGVGPNGGFVTAAIYDREDPRYLPSAEDKPLAGYVVVRPEQPEDRIVLHDNTMPTQGGREWCERQIQAAKAAKDRAEAAGKTAEQMQARIKELEAQLEQRKAEDSALAKSEASEEESRNREADGRPSLRPSRRA